MSLDEFEIAQSYRLAAHQGKQIKILAELNACSVDTIIGILEKHGEKVDRRTIPKEKKNKKLGSVESAVEQPEPVVEPECEPMPEEEAPREHNPVLTLGNLRRLTSDMDDNIVIMSNGARFVGLCFMSSYDVISDQINQTLELMEEIV